MRRFRPRTLISSIVLVLACGWLVWYFWKPTPPKFPVYISGPRANSISFSPDRTAKYFATAFSDGRVRLWESATQRELPVKLPSELPLNDIAWTSDGANLFVGGFEQHVLFWNVKTSVARKLPMFDAPIVSIAVRPQQPELLTSLSNGQLWRVDLQTGDRELIPTGHTGVVKVVRYHPAGKIFVTAGADTQLIWHDAETRQVTKQIIAHQHEISSLAFSRNGSRLLTGSWDKTSKIWSQDANEPTATFQHPDAVAHADWMGTNIVTSCWDHRLRLWNASTSTVLRERACRSDTLTFAVWPDQSEVAEVDESGVLQLTAP